MCCVIIELWCFIWKFYALCLDIALSALCEREPLVIVCCTIKSSHELASWEKNCSIKLQRAPLWADKISPLYIFRLFWLILRPFLHIVIVRQQFQFFRLLSVGRESSQRGLRRKQVSNKRTGFGRGIRCRHTELIYETGEPY